MRQVLEKNKKIAVYGSTKDVRYAVDYLNMFCGDIKEYSPEINSRRFIQKIIDDKNFKADILYDGNTVWSKNKVMRGIKRVKKNGMKSMTKYLYQFLTLSCGSIAHYDMYGWIAEYPTIEDLKSFFIRNEFGCRVLEYIPSWKSDTYNIVIEIEKELEIF